MRQGMMMRKLTHLEALCIPYELLERFEISSTVFECPDQTMLPEHVIVSPDPECIGWMIPSDAVKWVTDNDLVYQNNDDIL